MSSSHTGRKGLSLDWDWGSTDSRGWYRELVIKVTPLSSGNYCLFNETMPNIFLFFFFRLVYCVASAFFSLMFQLHLGSEKDHAETRLLVSHQYLQYFRIVHHR